jgi:hypothetical protein
MPKRSIHLPPPVSSRQWRESFEQSRSDGAHDIPWADGDRGLGDGQRSAIAASIAEFQLGESSEGRHLLEAARRWAGANGDDDYVAAIRLFIAEEQRHARHLGQFMDVTGIQRLRHSWRDDVFRWLRRRAGLELSISVLVSAEIIAQVYYVALLRATDSSVLQALCSRICSDEEQHVLFHCQRLAILRRRRQRVLLIATTLLHRLFMAAVWGVVWLKHGRALRAGGFARRTFRAAVRRQLDLALQQMDPRRYSLEAWQARLPASEPAEGIWSRTGA